VGRVLHAEVVALDYALEAFALAGASDIDHLPITEITDGNLSADFERLAVAIKTEFPEPFARLDAGRAEMSRSGLVDQRRTTCTRSYLNG